MYLDYFSLNRHPFRITPDPSLFFPGGKDGRGVILNALIYGITSGEGILKVVGEVGSGKTMLCRMLEEELPDTIEIVYIANPSLSVREILYAIAIELKLDVSSSTERLKVLHLLQDYLLKKHAQGGSVVVFIEEAQSMPLETLEEIRLLSNLETHQHKLMQIVLFGQPELDKILAQKNIRQLRERITHSFSLEPLSAQATSDYLRYRLKAAGCPREQLFSSRAEKLIARASTGLTRRINILADKALLSAYADSPSRQPPQEGEDPLVLPRHVKAAIRDSDYRNRYLLPMVLGGLGVASLAIAVTTVFIQDLWPFDETPGPVMEQQQVAAQPVSLPEPAARTEERNTPAVIEEAPEQESAAAVLIAETEEVVTPDQDSGTAEPVEEVQAPVTPELPPNTQPDAGQPIVVEESGPVGSSPLEEGIAEKETTEPSEPAVEESAPPVSIALAPEADPEPVPETPIEETVPAERSQEDSNVMPSPVTIVPSGLAELRMQPTREWLLELDGKRGYTIQLFSVPSTNPNGLEEYLQFLQLVSLLDDTYICFMPISSPTSGRWQVMHKEFQGVTPARNFIESLPEYVLQYGPYVRNLDGIQCSYPVVTGY